MAGSKSRIVNYLPGWHWIYKEDHVQWTTRTGRTSYERHAVAPDGQTYSVRDTQVLQRIESGKAGQPKPPTVPRQGRTKRLVNKGAPGQGSLYDPSIHGKSESWVFRSYGDAQNYFMLNPPPNWARNAIIQVRFTERLYSTNKVGSDKVGKKNGYASVSPYFDAQEISEMAQGQQYGGIVPNAWDAGAKNLTNYDMSGDKARVYVLFQEK